MMWPIIFFLIPLAFAQNDSDLKAIQNLEAELPNYDEYRESVEESTFTRQNRRFKPPQRIIKLEKIKASGTQFGSVSAGSLVRNLKDNKNYKLVKQTFVKVFNLEDEQNFKYILSKDGTVSWRIESHLVEPIKEELSLYVPPRKYTPAPDNIIRSEFDKKLTIRPEFSFYGGIVNGAFIADLFNDAKARNGLSTQYGAHFFTDWKLPVKVGGVLHYENTTYELTEGGGINYSALSFGPQLKSRDFEVFNHPIRIQLQFRVSPLAQLSAETTSGSVNYKFNSYDLLTSLERPLKNDWGEFVFGLYFQNQWLNLKDGPPGLSIEASNETNKSFGLSFSQVFQ